MFARSAIREQLWAYGRLVRLPNLFTAPPDVLLGVAIVVGSGDVTPLLVIGLACASVMLYAGGTTLNDAFDAPVDAVERPERPIPNGSISRRRAFGFGVALLGGGVGTALGSAGVAAASVAVGIAVLSVLYDGLLKDTLIGFLTMGSARGFNVLLGVVGGSGTLDGHPLRVYAVPIVIGGYIAAITYMAADETVGERRFPIAIAAGGVGVAVLACAGLLLLLTPSLIQAGISLTLGVMFLVWTGRALWTAYTEPTPSTVGSAVGTCVLGLVVLDGAFAASVGVLWAVGTAGFLLPAVVLSRRFDVT